MESRVAKSIFSNSAKRYNHNVNVIHSVNVNTTLFCGKKNPAEKRGEKKISFKAYGREKNILPTRLLEKKKLLTRNHPPPPLPSRVKWSAPN